MDPYNDRSNYGYNKVVKRRPCPRCRAQGRDRSGNNLIVYADGHEKCYACNYSVQQPTTLDSLRKLKEATVNLGQISESLNFPRDAVPLLDALFAKEPLQWVKSYHITDDEIKNHQLMWSAERKQLVMPYFDSAGVLKMFQVRNFNYMPQKYLTYGEKSGIMHLVGNPDAKICLVTEDLISAIKVGRHFQAMPLWGCSMDLGLIQKVAKAYDSIGIWLDHNKGQDAVRIALRASQYVPAFVVDAIHDPKTYSDVTIMEFVKAAEGKNVFYQENDFSPKNPATPFPPSPTSIDVVKSRLAEIDRHIEAGKKQGQYPVDSYLEKDWQPTWMSDLAKADKEKEAQEEWERKRLEIELSYSRRQEAKVHEYSYTKEAGGS